MSKFSFLKRALIINLVIFWLVSMGFIIFLQTPPGQPFGKTLLLVPELLPRFPVKPIKLLTKEPVVETVEFFSDGRKVVADVYRPKDNKKHPAIVVTLGVLATRQNSDLIKFAKAFSRVGYVVMIPDLPDLISGVVWTDSVEMLTASVAYLGDQNYIAKNRIGLTGFCVGGSVAIAAAENEKIADKVAFVVGISPYFNAYSAATAIVSKKQKLNGQEVDWEPSGISIETLKKQFAYAIDNPNERELVLTHLLENKEIPVDEQSKLSESSLSIYNFFNSGERNFELLPDNLKHVLSAISPDAKIKNFKAKLFILNDKKDSYLPRSEGQAFINNLPKGQLYFVEVDSFEHVNPATNLPRLALLKQLWHVGNFVYQIISATS